MIFVEAFEMFIDSKNNTEKKLSLMQVPCLTESKQGPPPDLVRVHSTEDLLALLQHISGHLTRETASHQCLRYHVWYESRFQTLTLLDLAFSDASATTYLDQTELHRTAHRLFKLLGNQRVAGGTGGKLMRELSALVLHGNAKVSIIG